VIGQSLGHFRILEKLGAGGMGVVYRAHDDRLDREVAVKVLLPEAAGDESARLRLLREARTASRLNHPHICTIHEVGEAGGQTYIVMEYLEGRPLRDLAPMPLENVIRLGAQIAEAVAYAHERGVVHRDLKSANVLIIASGRVKVLDFGLARRKGEAGGRLTETALTESGMIVGTLAYMAPEVLRGEPADERSDLWALGVMLHELITGELPFRGTGFELVSAILRESPAALPPIAPAALRAIVERCLVKEPAGRCQRAADVRAALEAVAVSPPPPRRARSQSTSRRVGRIKSLAVLPLEDLSRDPAQAFFADGMTDELITDLAKIGALRVTSRSSVMRYRGTDKPLPEVARELGVDGVVVGSVLRAGDQVRITAQLIHATSDTHIWADSYSRNLTNILTLQSEVAEAIAQAVKAKVTPQEKVRLSARPAINPAAHELYMRGRFFWNQRGSGLKKAVDLFQRALAEDPRYAPAYAGLADCYALLGFYGYSAPREVMPLAKANVAEALKLDPNLAEAHASLGFVHTIFDWEFDKAEAEFQLALRLNPSWSPARYWHSNLAMKDGRWDEAVAELRHGLEYDPLSVYMQVHLGVVLSYAERWQEAAAEFSRALDLAPNFLVARAWLGASYYHLSRLEDAVCELEAAVNSSDRDQMPLWMLGVVRASSGDRHRAQQILTELEHRSRTEYISALNIASIHAHLGQEDAAFEWLEKAYQERSSMLFSFGGYRMVSTERLRRDPRFQDLQRRIGLWNV